MPYIQVALNVPVFNTFTYQAPPVNLSGRSKSYEAQIGKRVIVPFGKRTMTGFIVDVFDNLALDDDGNAPLIDKIKTAERIIDEKALFDKEFANLAKWLCNFYLCTFGEALSCMIPSGKKEIDASGFCLEGEDVTYTKRTLSSEQQCAVDGIISSTKKMHYVYGKTGTGKTEVFLSVAEHYIKNAKSVLYLVPEIALTRQVIEAIIARFGSVVAVLHSGLTPSQKLFEWRRIQNGEVSFVVGARSAVFAPLAHLGMIIIDEEHDASYKSGNTPRYHARQVAMKRALTLDIPLVMGSATPSVESWKSMQEGKIVRHNLTRRLAGGEESTVSVVNLSKVKMSGTISPVLQEEIRATKALKRQTILFLNRRGFTHFFRCNFCGYELKCKNCSVALTYHKAQKRLRCHYCGFSVAQPTSCPECGSVDVGYSGFGTEFIENELANLFPDLKTVRIDSDSLEKKGDLDEKIAEFKAGKADILLGTQMVAKGLNFPNVKLVGIINADTGLHMPDFRASERTFALIVQVAGRAGRFFPDGKVIVQSWSPERDAIMDACTYNIEGFYQKELSERKVLEFPPFARLIRLVFRSKNVEKSKNAASDAVNILHSIDATIEILGPAECPLAQIAQNYRYQIILKDLSIARLQKCCSNFLHNYKAPHNVYIEADVDPVNLL